MVAVYTFTVLRTVISPLVLLFGHLGIFLLSLTIGPNFQTPHTHLYPMAIFSKSNGFLLGSEGMFLP